MEMSAQRRPARVIWSRFGHRGSLRAVVFGLPLAIAVANGRSFAQPTLTDSDRLKQEQLLKERELNQQWALKEQELGQTRELKKKELQQAGRLGVADLGLKVAGGIFAILAAWTAWKGYKLSRSSYELSERGQNTERFNAAVANLSDDNSIAKRIGGVYALARIANDSEHDFWFVMEMLTSFVRDRYSWVNPPRAVVNPVDIQAVLRALGRRNIAYEGENPTLGPA